MKYKENPKTRGSGIICCIPQTGICPNKCEDCFFQSGRSYLEPLKDNLPNVPPQNMADGRVVRMNDGHDSSVDMENVLLAGDRYPMKFYNTAIPEFLTSFDSPVMLTVNPGKNTDKDAVLLRQIPQNLMAVRVRTNLWNLKQVVDPAVKYYSAWEVPIILTFMAYFTGEIPKRHTKGYEWRKRTLNSYCAITTRAWEGIMSRYKYNKWVYSCGKIEGELGTTACRHCGNCLREYFATIEKMRE